jgi:hypothetical protein
MGHRADLGTRIGALTLDAACLDALDVPSHNVGEGTSRLQKDGGDRDCMGNSADALGPSRF